MIKIGRKTFRKIITSPEISSKINPKNRKLIDRFLKEKNIKCSDKTIKNYKSDLEIFFTYVYLEIDDKFFVDIKKLELSDFFAYCVSELQWGAARFARMKSCLSSLSEFVERFYDEDYPSFRNIILKAIDSMPKNPRREKLVLKEEEVNWLLDYLFNKKKNYQDACLLALAISSGARKSELLRFDIDILDENNTAFDDLFMVTSKKIKTKGHGKDGKMLEKYMIKDIFLPYYKAWLIERKKILEENGVAEHNKLFIKQNGEPMKVHGLENIAEKWSRYMSKKYEREINIYFHNFRHYTCTYLSRLGLEDSFIIELYGWSAESGGAMFKIYNDLEAKDKKWKNLDKLKEKLNS